MISSVCKESSFRVINSLLNAVEGAQTPAEGRKGQVRPRRRSRGGLRTARWKAKLLQRRSTVLTNNLTSL